MLNKMAKVGVLVACFFLIIVLTFVAFKDPSLGNIAKAITSVLVSTVLIGKLRQKAAPNSSTSQPKIIVIGIAIGIGLPIIFTLLVKALA